MKPTIDPALVPDFEGRYLENEKRFFKNNFETLLWGPNSIIRNQLVKTLQLTFKVAFPSRKSEFEVFIIVHLNDHNFDVLVWFKKKKQTLADSTDNE